MVVHSSVLVDSGQNQNPCNQSLDVLGLSGPFELSPSLIFSKNGRYPEFSGCLCDINLLMETRRQWSEIIGLERKTRG